MKNFPLAMQPPKDDVTLIQKSIVNDAIALSRQSPRKRIIYPFHKSASDRLHRMLNVIQTDSYIRPHSHEAQEKSESIIVLQGGICYITFDHYGTILSHQNIVANTDIFGVDSQPNVIHSFFALKEDTVIFEVKAGPYIKALDKGFADWAPEEHTAEAHEFLMQLKALTNNR